MIILKMNNSKKFDPFYIPLNSKKFDDYQKMYQDCPCGNTISFCQWCLKQLAYGKEFYVLP